MKGLPEIADPRVLVGLDTNDDAGVLQLSDEMALVQTVDFFTPIVDDPYDYGQIAAANALSDAYAMGAKPITALNIVGFPTTQLPMHVLADILRGGWDMAREAGVVILGGHSVKDPELKYGMAVTALVHPQKVVRNATAQPGDQLFLTKPIGTGILTTALKREVLEDTLLQEVTASMKQLNRVASEVMVAFHVTSATDVTGFSLMGHLHEMVKGSGVCVALDTAAIPLLRGALALAEARCVPGGLRDNQRFYGGFVDRGAGIEDARYDLLFDPQTSGGLLFSVPKQHAQACLEALHARGLLIAAHIGEILPSHGESSPILLR